MNTILPIYYQIKHTIKNWLVNKEFVAGEKIPSENELAARFKVSRLTVRQAITQLVQEGFLTSRRGQGTFVTGSNDLINTMSIETSGFMDDLFFNQMSQIVTKSVSMRRIPPSKSVREKLKLEQNEKEIVEIKRVRLLNDRMFTFSINHLPLQIGSRICEDDLYKNLLVEVLEKKAAIQFTEAVQTIEASFANQEVAEKLEIPLGSPILFVERIMYSTRARPIELFQSSYRGDLFKFFVRFRKVRHRGGSQWIHRLD